MTVIQTSSNRPNATIRPLRVSSTVGHSPQLLETQDHSQSTVQIPLFKPPVPPPTISAVLGTTSIVMEKKKKPLRVLNLPSPAPVSHHPLMSPRRGRRQNHAATGCSTGVRFREEGGVYHSTQTPQTSEDEGVANEVRHRSQEVVGGDGDEAVTNDHNDDLFDDEISSIRVEPSTSALTSSEELSYNVNCITSSLTPATSPSSGTCSNSVGGLPTSSSNISQRQYRTDERRYLSTEKKEIDRMRRDMRTREAEKRENVLTNRRNWQEERYESWKFQNGSSSGSNDHRRSPEGILERKDSDVRNKHYHAGPEQRATFPLPPSNYGASLLSQATLPRIPSTVASLSIQTSHFSENSYRLPSLSFSEFISDRRRLSSPSGGGGWKRKNNWRRDAGVDGADEW